MEQKLRIGWQGGRGGGGGGQGWNHGPERDMEKMDCRVEKISS